MSSPKPYRYRRSVIHAETEIRLKPDGIVTAAEGRERFYPYASIRAVRLSYEPTRYQSELYFCRIWVTGRQRPIAVISSASYRGFLFFETHSTAYRALVLALHQRLLAGGVRAEFRAGVSAWTYWGQAAFLSAAVALFAAVMLAIGDTAEWSGSAWVKWAVALTLAPVAFAWFFANRPRGYDPAALPPEVLPPP
jgi:hypothetical protein